MIPADLLPHGPSQFAIRIVHPHATTAANDLDFGELMRILNGQAAQPDGVYDLKNRGVRANAKSKRNDGDHSEARALR